MKNLTVLKIGGSLLTDRNSSEPKLADDELLKRLASEVADFYHGGGKLVIVIGAGSYGHPIVRRSGIDKGVKNAQHLKDFAEVQIVMNSYLSSVAQYFLNAGLPAIPIQASASAIMTKTRLKKMNFETVELLLKIGMIPILSGVPAYDSNQGCSILSGDEIAPYLARKLNARRIVHATEVDGIFTADPKTDKAAQRIPLVTRKNVKKVLAGVTGSRHTDVTGGMEKKLRELLNAKVDSQIVSALTPGNLRRALNEEKVGTTVKVS